MADVLIDIPGVGKVTATNAASEDTLLKILDVMSKSEKKKQEDDKKAREVATKALKDEKTQRDALSGKLGEDAKKQAELTIKKKQEAEAIDRVVGGLTQTGGAIAGFGASLTKTAVSLTAQFATAYESMANNPIGAAAGLLNTGIDTMATGAKAAVDASSGLAKGLLGAVPFIGSAAAGVVDGLNAAAKAAIDLAATITKSANAVMAAEFEKSAKQLADYTKAGASFAGGMMEMRDVAHDAGLTLTQMGKAAELSSENFRNMGLTQGEGVKALSAGMKATAKTLGTSGSSIRDEMLALGYSYEEQGAIMGQFMAQQKASGQLEKMTTEEIAKGTKDYAVNLKVLSDITGQDAKKLQEKARVESMRGALEGKLSADQAKAYKDSYSSMMAMGPEMGPKLQQALTQVMAGGPVTDPIIAGNAELMAMINKTSAQAMQGNADMTVETQRNLSDASKAIKDHGETATDTAALYGKDVGGVASGMAAMNNAFRAFQLDPDAAEKSKKAALEQAAAADPTTKAYQQITAASTAAAVEMQKLASSNLGTYAEVLGKTFTEAADAFKTGIKLIKGEIKPIDLIGGNKSEPTGDIGNPMGDFQFDDIPKMASGGGITGPKSGYLAMLHGTEAVIPEKMLSGEKLSSDVTSMAKSMSDVRQPENPFDKLSADLGKLFGVGDKMVPTQAPPTNDSSISDLIAHMKAASSEQLAKFDAVIKAMEETKDATERLNYNLS
jgi:hypothetical protein